VKAISSSVCVLGLLLLTSCGHYEDHASADHDADGAVAAVEMTPADRVHVSADSDAKAIEIAQSVMEQMGGWEAWENTRCLKWRFFGGRLHHWDRQTSDIRIEGPFGGRDNPTDLLVLMNVDSRQGRAFKSGVELEGADLEAALQQGYEAWINDSYWMVMPYKLLDEGVTLSYVGEREMDDGRISDVLGMSFDGVGVTPQNGYEIFVARDTGLVEQWSFFAAAGDEEPRFTMPWAGWQEFGEIKLSTSRGRDNDWEIAVMDDVPESIFTSPEPVSP
jgi:hypothetical protein